MSQPIWQRKPGAVLIGVLVALAAGGALPEITLARAAPAPPSVPTPMEQGDIPEVWWDQVTRAIAAEEYDLSWQARPDGAAWQAPNRAHGFRAWFRGGGIEIEPRSPEQPAWRWRLRLVAYGRNGLAVPAPDINQVEAVSADLTYRRSGLDEWFRNTPSGLEHGFTLALPPEELTGGSGPPALATPAFAPGPRLRRHSATEAQHDRLHLDLMVEGGLHPVVASDGQAVDFFTPAGQAVLRYSKLHIQDARGVPVTSWMEGYSQPGRSGIRIVFTDDDLVFPLEVDPLITAFAWSQVGDQTSSRLGSSVASAGDVNGDGYTDVVIGAALYDNGHNNEGRAYVYLGSASGLGDTPVWVDEGDQTSAQFGFAVGGAGDVNGDGYADILVGANSFDSAQINQGRAFAYLGSADGPSPAPDWIGQVNKASAQFGNDVGSAGDVNGDGYSDVIIGVRRYENLSPNEGRAYVFYGSASGLSATADWIGERGQADAQYGFDVTTAGDVNGDGYADVLVGAYRCEDGELAEGCAFLHLGSAEGLGEEPAWFTGSDQENALLGWSVATAGDVNGDGYADILMSSLLYTQAVENEGAVWLFKGSPEGPAPEPDWVVFSGQSQSLFGKSVATAGDVNGDGFSDVLVGAYGYDAADRDEGAAFLYLGSASGLHAEPGWTATVPQSAALHGWSVAHAGDVNGDGHDDLIAGAAFYDGGQVDEGAAWVFHGTPQGLSLSPAWSVEGQQDFAGLGMAVSGAGDVNGDGFAEVMVGAPSYAGSHQNEGQVLAFSGSPSGLADLPFWSREGGKGGINFGWSLAEAGDVNGDGYADILIGARRYRNGERSEGGAFVYLGHSGGLEDDPVWSGEGNQVGALFGHSVAGAGDVNGDGFSDVVIGAPFYDNGRIDEGAAFLYLGSVSGPSPLAAWLGDSNQNQAGFGSAVAGAGDTNGDGFADVLIGAPYYDAGQMDEGAAFLYQGDAAGLSAQPVWQAFSDQAFAAFGSAVAGAGDINGDGFTDVLIGAPEYDNGEGGEGSAWLYNGSAAGLGEQPAAIIESNQAGAQLGNAVTMAGDVNGDGYTDVAVGARLFDANQPDSGATMAYYGNGRGGLSLRPEARSSSLTTLIPQLGWSDDRQAFSLTARARSPFGTGRVKLQWEIKPQGTLFDGTDIGESASWFWLLAADIAADTNLQETITGLTPGTGYHWRLRLLYQPASTPFMRVSRWLTRPLNGWNEQDLSTAMQGDLSLSVTGSADPVTNIETLDYQVTAFNAGPDDDVAVTVRSTLPAGAVFAGAQPSQGSCSESAGLVTCHLGLLAAGANADIDIQAAAPLAGGVATHTATIAGATRDPDPGDNTASEDTQVNPVCFVPSLALEITDLVIPEGQPAWLLISLLDSNDPVNVDGYNIYRTVNADLAAQAWPLLGNAVGDGDAGEPGVQWTDVTGDMPEGNQVFFYQAVAYNATCDADGPR